VTPLACQRDAFTLPPNVCYLNSAYMGPLPRAIQDATQAALAVRATPYLIGAEDFFAPAEAAPRACAALVGADPERTGLMPTVAYAIATAMQNLAVAPGQTTCCPVNSSPATSTAGAGWSRRAFACG